MFHCVYDGLHCRTCNRFCYKWLRKQVSSHLKKHYLNTIKILWCSGVFFQRKISSFLSDWACSCSWSTTIIFPCCIVPPLWRALHGLGRGASALGKLRAQIGGRRNPPKKGRAEPQVTQNIVSWYCPHACLWQSCMCMRKRGTNTALLKSCTRFELTWDCRAPGLWHPHGIEKDVS